MVRSHWAELVTEPGIDGVHGALGPGLPQGEEIGEPRKGRSGGA